MPTKPIELYYLCNGRKDRAMKLSIITVNLNNRDGLQKTIDSVVSQTFRDFEWIVIDGGSTDGSKELIEQYADHFAYWVSEPDKGVYNAMNKGIKVAKGDYLQFLNSGDWLYNETALERCFSHGFTADIAYGDLYLRDKSNSIKCCYPDTLTFSFFFQKSLCHNATFIKRRLIVDVLYNENLRIVSDWEFFIIQYVKNSTFFHIKEFLISYDMSGISSANIELLKKERDTVIRNIIPVSLIHDFDKIGEMEERMNRAYVKKVLKYSEKSKLYRKMTSAFLTLIDFIDRAISKI